MSGAILLDTSIIIDQLRGHPGAGVALDDAVEVGKRLTASVLTKVEILHGMRSAERSLVRRLFDALEWHPVDDDTAELAGALARRYRASHHNVDAPDYVIAATAELRNAELWTRNVKHFPMFDGLRSPY